MADPLYPDLEGPTYPSPLEVGDTVVVNGNLSSRNDVGGTLMLEMTDTRCVVTQAFWDYEAGWRFVGKLADEAEIEAVRLLGSTGYTAEHYLEKFPEVPGLAASVKKSKEEFDPSKVFFSEHDIPQPLPVAGY